VGISSSRMQQVDEEAQSGLLAAEEQTPQADNWTEENSSDPFNIFPTAESSASAQAANTGFNTDELVNPDAPLAPLVTASGGSATSQNQLSALMQSVTAVSSPFAIFDRLRRPYYWGLMTAGAIAYLTFLVMGNLLFFTTGDSGVQYFPEGLLAIYFGAENYITPFACLFVNVALSFYTINHTVPRLWQEIQFCRIANRRGESVPKKRLIFKYGFAALSSALAFFILDVVSSNTEYKSKLMWDKIGNGIDNNHAIKEIFSITAGSNNALQIFYSAFSLAELVAGYCFPTDTQYADSLDDLSHRLRDYYMQGNQLCHPDRLRHTLPPAALTPPVPKWINRLNILGNQSTNVASLLSYYLIIAQSTNRKIPILGKNSGVLYGSAAAISAPLLALYFVFTHKISKLTSQLSMKAIRAPMALYRLGARGIFDKVRQVAQLSKAELATRSAYWLLIAATLYINIASNSTSIFWNHETKLTDPNLCSHFQRSAIKYYAQYGTGLSVTNIYCVYDALSYYLELLLRYIKLQPEQRQQLDELERAAQYTRFRTS